MRLQKYLVSGINIFKDNLPTILTGIGMGGVVATAFLTGRATLKADEAIKEAENTIGKELDFKEKFKVGIKYYIPAVIAGLGTMISIVYSNRVSAKKLAAVATVATTTQKALIESREGVKELFGEKGLRKLDEKINEKHAAEYFGKVSHVYETGHGSTLCCEGFLTGLLFRASREWIAKCVNDFNMRLISGEILSYNDFLEMLVPNIDRELLPDVGDRFGYNLDIRRKTLEIVEDSFLLHDGSEPGLIFNLVEMPLFEQTRYY